MYDPQDLVNPDGSLSARGLDELAAQAAAVQAARFGAGYQTMTPAGAVYTPDSTPAGFPDINSFRQSSLLPAAPLKPLECWYAAGKITDTAKLEGRGTDLARADIDPAWVAGNVLEAVPFWSGRGGTIDALGFRLVRRGGRGGRARIGVYTAANPAGGDLSPGDLLWDTDDFETDKHTEEGAVKHFGDDEDPPFTLRLAPGTMYWFVWLAEPADLLDAPVQFAIVGGNTGFLAVNTTYYFSITALFSDGTESCVSNEKSIATNGTGPEQAPPALAAGGTLASGTTYYYVVTAIQKDGSESQVGNEVSITTAGPGPAVLSTNLQNGGALADQTTYYYSVTAVFNSGGETGVGAELSALTASPDLAVIVTWNTLAGAGSYKVYRSQTSGVYLSPCLIASTNAATYTDAAASPATGAPPNPVGLSVTLTWSAIADETGYKIYRSQVQGVYTTPALIATLGAVLTYTDTGASPTTGAPPGNSYSVTLSWGPVAEATGYNIYGGLVPYIPPPAIPPGPSYASPSFLATTSATTHTFTEFDPIDGPPSDPPLKVADIGMQGAPDYYFLFGFAPDFKGDPLTAIGAPFPYADLEEQDPPGLPQKFPAGGKPHGVQVPGILCRFISVG